MRLVFDRGPEVLELVARLSPIEQPVWANATPIGIVTDGGKLIGGAVLSEHRPAFSTLELSGCAVSSQAFGPRICREIGGIIFEKLDVYRLWARTGFRNHRAQRFLERVGFTQEGVQSHYYGLGHHATQWRLLKPEWEALWGAFRLQKAA